MTTQAISKLHEQYLADGFSINAYPVLPADIVQAAVVGMDEVRAGRYDTGIAPQPSYWKPGDDPNTKLGKIEMPQTANHAIMRLMQHPALGALAAAVTGAKAVQIWWVQLLYKPATQSGAATTTNVGWHQDRHYWKSWDDESVLFTAWVALSDVTEQAGPMIFVRGSHRWGFSEGSDFFGQDLATLRRQIEEKSGNPWEEATAILPPGGVSFHHNLTFHGSGPNLSGLPRRSFAIHMRTEKSRPRDGLRQGLTQFIDNLAFCPVIYGDAALFG